MKASTYKVIGKFDEEDPKKNVWKEVIGDRYLDFGIRRPETSTKGWHIDHLPTGRTPLPGVTFKRKSDALAYIKVLYQLAPDGAWSSDKNSDYKNAEWKELVKAHVRNLAKLGQFEDNAFARAFAREEEPLSQEAREREMRGE